jgi:hypothetical protein
LSPRPWIVDDPGQDHSWITPGSGPGVVSIKLSESTWHPLFTREYHNSSLQIPRHCLPHSHHVVLSGQQQYPDGVHAEVVLLTRRHMQATLAVNLLQPTIYCSGALNLGSVASNTRCPGFGRLPVYPAPVVGSRLDNPDRTLRNVNCLFQSSLTARWRAALALPIESDNGDVTVIDYDGELTTVVFHLESRGCTDSCRQNSLTH